MLGKTIINNTLTPFDVVVYEYNYERKYEDYPAKCDMNACHDPAKYLIVTQMRWACQFYKQQNVCSYHGKHVIKGLKEQKIGK